MAVLISIQHLILVGDARLVFDVSTIKGFVEYDGD